MVDNDQGDEAVDENYDPEAEVTATFRTDVNLPEVPVVTGEEEENILAVYRAKLYRWRDK